jgi:thioredoxin-dependent peroxiredoxin
MASSVKAGDPAPDFSLPSADGQTIRLSDFRGQSEVVLFFYPKDDSPACTAEACSFRDSHEAFLGAGAVVIGVSSDPPGEHRAFAGKHRLPFPLLTDADGSLRALYRVPKTLGLIPGRVTYLIDRLGIVRHVYSSQLRPANHVRQALRGLEEIRSQASGVAGGSS